jgi:DNA-binding transcriptional regulator YhcF (GntR family)
MRMLQIDRALDRPVYEQIADQLRRLIADDELQAGSSLPPVRRLAGDLGVNLNTVARAYRMLADEGFLSIRHRTGVTVAAPGIRLERPVRDALIEQLRVAMARLRQAGMTEDELRQVVASELHAPAGDKGGSGQ